MVQVVKYASDVSELSYIGSYFYEEWSRCEEWDNLYNITNSSESYADCNVSGKEVTPTPIYLHEFNLNIPAKSKIKNIRVEYKLSSNNVNCDTPLVGIFWGESIGHLEYPFSEDMFANEEFVRYPSSPTTFTFDMKESDIKRNNLTHPSVNKDTFGVILYFPPSSIRGEVRVHWVRLVVDYDVDSYALKSTANEYYTENEAYKHSLKVHSPLTVAFQSIHTSTYTGDDYTVDVDIPFGLTVQSYTTVNSTFNEDTEVWSCKAGVNSELKLTLVPITLGLKEISLKSTVAGQLSTYYYVNVGTPVYSADKIVVNNSTLRDGVEGYFIFDWEFINNSDMVQIGVFKNEDMDTFSFTHFELDTNYTSPGVKLENNRGNVLSLTVPPNTECYARIKAYFTPETSGEHTLYLEVPVTSGNIQTYDYYVLDPYVYQIDLKSSDIIFEKSRLISQVGTDAYIFPCRTSPFDDTLIVGKPTLCARMYKELDYIGCIPLSQTHYNPSASYKDSLLNTAYRNKRYMGKQNNPDETISLNVRLHPYDVSTLYGLIEMDKPVPLNTNHKAFEGDVLNHRGWAELYSVSNISKTNPSWYDCDISVKYITHNINTRFQITKGSNVSNYFLPNLLVDTIDSGEDLEEYFEIDTNGSYTYMDSIDDLSKRNMYVLDEGQYIRIISKDVLSPKSKFTFTWNTSRVIENKDNNLSRIIRLIDRSNGNAVLEYEYYDLDFETDYLYTGRVICRLLYKGAYKTILNRPLTIHSDAEYDGTSTNVDTYGSKIDFELMGNTLNILDEGFSGKEVYLEGITLENSDYYFEVEFINNNTDIDTPPIMNYFDVTLKELELTSDYSQYYDDLLVSPFPVPGKKIVYTRDSQEGTIYYLYDDGTETTYLLSPFYQYYTGVNLESREGISLMNLNNSHSIVYINNGLVKMGINRITGELYLYKYDRVSKSFVHVYDLQLTKYDDLNLNYFSDDKIELQASDTIITMWRGRPFIQFNHPTEDILLNERVYSVYGEKVGEYSSEFSQEFSLIDNDNMFPKCVGSLREIESTCIDVVETSYDWEHEGNLTLTVPSEHGLSSPVTIKSKSTTHQNCKVYYIIDDEVLSVDFFLDNNGSSEIEYKFDTEGEHTVQAVIAEKNGIYDYVITEKETILIKDDYYLIEPLFSDIMYFRQENFRARLTLAKEPVVGETLLITVNGLTYPLLTDEDGIANLNNELHPGRYTVKMAYEEGDDLNIVTFKDTQIKKGYVNINADSTNIKRHTPFRVRFTNNLDPDFDDEEDNYVKGEPVVISVNGVSYPRITDDEGYAELMINLWPRTYDLSVTFAGSRDYEPNSKMFEIVVKEQ